MRSATAGLRDIFFRFSDPSVFLEWVEPDSLHGWITTDNYWRTDNNKRVFIVVIPFEILSLLYIFGHDKVVRFKFCT